MQFVATITHPINLAIGETTWIVEAGSYLEAVQILERAKQLANIRKLELTTAKPLPDAPA